MYPRNNATPPRIAIGAVIQISDGAVQTTGIDITVRAEGGAEGAGGGTTNVGASGIVYYTPLQAETNHVAFAVIATKTGCFPVAQTVVTTAAAVAGKTDVGAINGVSAAAVRLALSANQIIPGTVDTDINTHFPTATEFQADDITTAIADHYNGRIIIFTGGPLAGQATEITDYDNVGGIGQFTVVALTAAPSDGDTFIIV